MLLAPLVWWDLEFVMAVRWAKLSYTFSQIPSFLHCAHDCARNMAHKNTRRATDHHAIMMMMMN